MPAEKSIKQLPIINNSTNNLFQYPVQYVHEHVLDPVASSIQSM